VRDLRELLQRRAAFTAFFAVAVLTVARLYTASASGFHPPVPIPHYGPPPVTTPVTTPADDVSPRTPRPADEREVQAPVRPAAATVPAEIATVATPLAPAPQWQLVPPSVTGLVDHLVVDVVGTVVGTVVEDSTAALTELPVVVGDDVCDLGDQVQVPVPAEGSDDDGELETDGGDSGDSGDSGPSEDESETTPGDSETDEDESETGQDGQDGQDDTGTEADPPGAGADAPAGDHGGDPAGDGGSSTTNEGAGALTRTASEVRLVVGE
jgi:hypothetical protein